MPRSFYARPVLDVAADLLGATVTHGAVTVRLTEVEAYDGAEDPASHAYRGPTARNAVMFGEPGHLYVYFTYGMHHCANLVCGPAGTACAVLLRAGEVTGGVELARSRRGRRPDTALARGPACLVRALGLGPQHNGIDVCTTPAIAVRPPPDQRGSVRSGPRVGVRHGSVTPWRFWLDAEPTVSAYRPAAPRRARVR